MLKIVTPLVALAAAIAPVAAADADAAKDITVEFKYDNTLLADEAGAKTVIASLKDQAEAACTYRSSINFMETVDRSCAKSAVAIAAAKIVAEREAEGLETAAIFEQKATVQVASLD